MELQHSQSLLFWNNNNIQNCLNDFISQFHCLKMHENKYNLITPITYKYIKGKKQMKFCKIRDEQTISYDFSLAGSSFSPFPLLRVHGER